MAMVNSFSFIGDNKEGPSKAHDGKRVGGNMKPFMAAIRQRHPHILGLDPLAPQSAQDGSLLRWNVTPLTVLELASAAPLQHGGPTQVPALLEHVQGRLIVEDKSFVLVHDDKRHVNVVQDGLKQTLGL
jgi:hypothetical protein